MREGTVVIGVVASDLHLSHNPPAARAETREEWYQAMGRMLEHMGDVASHYGVPLFLAGDLFHAPDPPPELINAAILGLRAALPGVFAVPGQHDLYHHDLDAIMRTGFYTLGLSKVIAPLGKIPMPFLVNGERLRVWGLSWGEAMEDLVLPKKKDLEATNILIAHRYVWFNDRTRHSHATEDGQIKSLNLSGFDIACFGDNHVPWSWHWSDERRHVVVINCGSTMRRHIDQLDHKPKVWLLTKTEGSSRVGICTIDFPCQYDKMIDPAADKTLLPESGQLKEFLESLGQTVTLGSDLFEQSVMDYLSKARLSRRVQELVRTFLDERKK